MLKDPVLQKLYQQIETHLGIIEPIVPVPKEEYFQALTENIIGQQLAVRAAEVITERFRTVVGSEFTPKAVLAIPFETLRGAGLSNAKTQYVRNIAQAWTDGTVPVKNIDELDDETLIAELTKIKGVGRWTAEMFLIFTLGRPDVFSVGDYGLKKGMIKAYQLDPAVKPQQLLELSQAWQPHRTLASRVLWKSLELPDR